MRDRVEVFRVQSELSPDIFVSCGKIPITNTPVTNNYMRIAILSSSTRVNRQSHRAALGLAHFIEKHGVHTAEILDLAVSNFPLLEEVLHRHPNAPTGLAEFADQVRQADAYLFVSPEYNGSYTAALKNAVDYLKEGEFARKVIGIVSVTSGPLGGIRAALSMQQLVLGIAGIPIPQMLTIGLVGQKFDEEGQLLDPTFEKNIQTFLRHFLWLAEAVVDKKVAEADGTGGFSRRLPEATIGG